MNLESGGQFGDYQNEIYLDGLSTMPMPACSAVAPQTVSD